MEKNCVSCGNSFVITDDDLAFYEKISPEYNGKKYAIPPPTHCPQCRLQRRISWRNERSLYKRSCDLCSKNIISVHPTKHPFPVYCNTCWWSDEWNPLDFGRKFDFSKPFIDQFLELRSVVPQIAIMNDDGISSENCEYCQDFVYGKNCYMCIGTWHMHDSCHCLQCDYTKDMVDCMFAVINCELCYECIDSQKLYHCVFLKQSENCSNCYFGYDLKGCKYCFACTGLRNKEYCIHNEQYSKEEYEKKINEYSTGSYKNFLNTKKEFEQWSQDFPLKHLNMQNCEDSLGDNIFNCKAVTNSFIISNGEYTRYSNTCEGPLWCYDVYNSGNPELCCDCWTVDESYQVAWCQWTNRCKNSYYCDSCDGAHNLFGCISARKTPYCILNKQYSKEEYEELIPKIIDHMTDFGEWGEFFPMNASPLAYNESVACEYFPLTEKDAKAKGLDWKEDGDEMPDVEKVIDADKLPDSIDDIPDDVLNWAIRCSETKRPFKLLKHELEIYRTLNVPIPRLHPDVRHRQRLQRRNLPFLWERQCSKCNKNIQTTYAPDRTEMVYCEECYLAEVY